jgi:hypothetical protein
MALTLSVLLASSLAASQPLERHLKSINACRSISRCCCLRLLLPVLAELSQSQLHPQLLALTVILQQPMCQRNRATCTAAGNAYPRRCFRGIKAYSLLLVAYTGTTGLL